MIIPASRVVTRYLSKTAMEFPTEEAMRDYLKEHPDADKSKHTVKKKEEPKEKEPLKKDESGSKKSENHGVWKEHLNKQLEKHKDTPSMVKRINNAIWLNDYKEDMGFSAKEKEWWEKYMGNEQVRNLSDEDKKFLQKHKLTEEEMEWANFPQTGHNIGDLRKEHEKKDKKWWKKKT